VNRGSIVAAAGCALIASWYAPAATAIGPLRRLLAPGLAGLGDHSHVSLTFDDGPHPLTTPHFLTALDALDVRATFFVLGTRLARSPGLARDLADAGHELAVHGWDHRCLAWRAPRGVYDDLARTRDLIAETTGRAPRWCRPAYGVPTLPMFRAARRLDLTPVLWTDWGRDWTCRATPDAVAATVTARLHGGAVVLLHDAAAGRAEPTAWRASLGALPQVLEYCQARNLAVGPLAEHGLRHLRT